MVCERDESEQHSEISIPCIEVQPEVLTTINAMILGNHTQCVVNNITIQNGLTTNQVDSLEKNIY